MSPTYNVTINSWDGEIEADNEDEAEDKARDIAADQTTVELVEDDEEED
jgi:hypothetical protein